jgi:hypothetical protein
MKLGERIKKNAYVYFTVKLLLLIGIVFILDFTIGHTLRYYFYKQECGRQYRAITAIDKTKADVLIFGSSTAYHHFIPSILAKRLDETCYNMGSPGQGILFEYAVLQAVTKRYTPKMIILDVNLREFKAGKDYYDRLSFLLPFYKDHEEMRPIIDLKSPLEKYKMLSSIYAYNSSFLIIAGGNSEYFKKKNADVDGFKPNTRVWDQPMKDYDMYAYPMDSVKIGLFKTFIEDCKKSGIKLLIVLSPKYVHFQFREYSISVIDQIAKEQNTPFIDFSSDTTFTNHRDYFDDDSHLNGHGAEVFTHVVADKLDSMKLR